MMSVGKENLRRKKIRRTAIIVAAVVLAFYVSIYLYMGSQ